MFKLAIPVLHVSSSAAAEEFYCTNREMYVKDTDGNSIRFVREGGG